MQRRCQIGDIEVGEGRPLAIIAGPCSLESESLALEIAGAIHEACRRHELAFIFKGSFDKANRTSAHSKRGPGLEAGVEMLERVRNALAVPITTDIHDPAQADPVGQVVDLIQIPAFLCRQTDLIAAAGRAAVEHGRAVNIKKGQFLSPSEMTGPAGKLLETGCERVMLTERGTFFGYQRLVNDFIGVGDLMELRVQRAGAPEMGPWPVCFDCTHSTQLPGAGATTAGRPERAPMLARAAVAAGVDAIFLECHPDPSKALSDAATMLPLSDVPDLLGRLAQIRRAAGF